jgi:hypothetical protein
MFELAALVGYGVVVGLAPGKLFPILARTAVGL